MRRIGSRHRSSHRPVILVLVLLFSAIVLLSGGQAARAAGGALDPGFLAAPLTGPNGPVTAMVMQPDGKLVIAGPFTAVHGVARRAIARLNADGSLDTAFDVQLSSQGEVRALALQDNGKIVLGGWFSTVNGITRASLARLNVDGSLDREFAPYLPLSMNMPDISAVAVEIDQQIVIGGTFQLPSSGSTVNIARFTKNGQVDDTFNIYAARGHIRAIVAEPTGHLLIAGGFTTVYDRTGPVARPGLARLDHGGWPDPTFDPRSGADGPVTAMAVEPDGHVLIGGAFTTVDGQPRAALARLTSIGRVDLFYTPTFNSGAAVAALLVQPNGLTVVGGSFSTIGGIARRNVARLTASGGVDESFDPGSGADGLVAALAVQPDGKLVLGGGFSSVAGVSRLRLARLLGTPGTLTLNSGGMSVSEGSGSATLVVQRSGGSDTALTAQLMLEDHTTNPRDYRSPASTVDPGFLPAPMTGVDDGVNALAVQPDGKILVAGFFKAYNNEPRPNLIRILPNGREDPSFRPGSGPNASVYELAVQRDGKIVMIGNFTSVDGRVRNRIARLNADGSLDTTFDVQLDSSVSLLSLALDSADNILFGGMFATVNGVSRTFLARVDHSGKLDPTFQPNLDSQVNTIAVQPDGKIVIGGTFDRVDGVLRIAVARLNVDGSLDPAYDARLAADAVVYTIALQSSGSAIITGNYPNPYTLAQQNTFLLRMLPGGSSDAAFPRLRFNDSIVLISVRPDDTFFIGGMFSTINGQSRGRIARLQANGELDQTFDTTVGANDSVYTIAFQDDGAILLGGRFTTIQGEPRNNLARLGRGIFLHWAAGEVSDRVLTLPIVDDVDYEGDETLRVTLTTLTGGAASGTPAQAMLTIVDNDARLSTPRGWLPLSRR